MAERPASGGGNVLFYDFPRAPAPAVQHPDEFNIDEFLAEPGNTELAAAVDAQGPWVAETLYPGETHLAALRLRAGLSQKELGRQCGILQPAVARYESGAVAPNVFTAAKMATCLGVSLEELVYALERTAAKAPA